MRCDESLGYWSAVFVVTRLREHGNICRGFIEDPPGWLKAMDLASAPVGSACGHRPLLPRQRRVAQALWRRWKREAH